MEEKEKAQARSSLGDKCVQSLLTANTAIPCKAEPF